MPTPAVFAVSRPITVAAEHRATEALLAASGIKHIMLLNGWYAENYTRTAAVHVEQGAVFASAGEGRISAASRTDYAEGAAFALTGPAETRIYELAGHDSFSMSELAAVLSDVSGKSVKYHDLPQDEFAPALKPPVCLSGLLRVSRRVAQARQKVRFSMLVSRSAD